jgi:hypothetical protein
MSNFIPIFKGALGLNNVSSSNRLNVDHKTMVGELVTAYNVDIDSSGRVRRCLGWQSTAQQGDVKNLFCEGGDCLFTSGTSLYKLNSDYSRVGLRSGLTENAPMAYAQAPGRIFYTNGFELGYVQDDHSFVWSVGTYIGPDNSRVYQNPPVGTLLTFYAGRVYVARGPHIYFSEGFNWGAFDYARNFFMYSSDVIMLKAVNDGLFVSTEDAIYFIGGRNPREFEQIMIAPYPAIPNTAVSVDASFIGDGSKGRTVIWTSAKGICIGRDGGAFENVTTKRLIYPLYSRGTATALRNKYLVLMKK